jgi:hypothetical protein
LFPPAHLVEEHGVLVCEDVVVERVVHPSG